MPMGRAAASRSKAGFTIIAFLSYFVRRVTFGEHGPHDLPFVGPRDNTHQGSLQHDHSALVFVHCLSRSAPSLVNFRNSKVTGDGISQVNRFLETKAHAGGEPPNLAPDSGDHTSYQEAMANRSAQLFYLYKSLIKMDWIVVLGNVGKKEHVLSGEGA